MLGFVVALSLILPDSRANFTSIVLPLCCIWSSLADATPSGIRRISTICGIGFGCIFLLSIQVGLVMKWISVTEVKYQAGSVTLTGSGLATSCILNWIIFCIRNIHTAIWNPTSMTVITSSVKSERVSKTEARVWYTAFHLKEAARYLQEEEEDKGDEC